MGTETMRQATPAMRARASAGAQGKPRAVQRHTVNAANRGAVDGRKVRACERRPCTGGPAVAADAHNNDAGSDRSYPAMTTGQVAELRRLALDVLA